MGECVICGRESSEDFCYRHMLSYQNLRKTFNYWRSAMKIEWKEFLDELRKNPNTGVWVKEVVDYLLKKEEGRKI